MATLYCDYTNGDDTTGDGSSGNPYKTLQKAINVGASGDTFNVANTSAQVIASPINFTSGFSLDTTKSTTITSWDNGGGLSIQRPDEIAARVAAVIDINGNSEACASPIINLSWQNIRFINTTSRGLYVGDANSVIGCEFSGSYQIPIDITGYGAVIANNYLHSITSSFYGIWVRQNAAKILNNYIAANISLPTVIQLGSDYLSINGNIIEVMGTGSVAINLYSLLSQVNNNTIISDGTSNNTGLLCSRATYPNTVFNNLFYNFIYTGAKALDFSAGVGVNLLGYQSYYNCNSNGTPQFIAADFTGQDVASSSNPFTNSVTGDYTLDSSTAVASIGTALSNYDSSSLNRGAYQSTSSGGGSATLASAWVG